MRKSYGRFHPRDFDDTALVVIGGPLADLLAVVKISGTHDRPVLSKPLPVARENVVDDVAPGLDASVFMTVDAFSHAKAP